MTRLIRSTLGLGALMVLAGALHAAAPPPPQVPVTVATLAGTAPLSPLVSATGIAVAPNGDLYIYEGDFGVIRKRTPAGDLSVVAGVMGTTGSVDGQGSAARLSSGGQLVRATDGTLYFAEAASHTIRKVSPSGAVTTIAGLAGQAGSADGIGAAARFDSPMGILVDASQRVYVADTANRTIRRIDPDGTVITFAGVAGSNSIRVDGVGAAARFSEPRNMAFSDAGDLLVIDSRLNARIRRITTGAVVTTVAIVSQPQAIVNVGGGQWWVSTQTCRLHIVTEAGGVTAHPASPSSGGPSSSCAPQVSMIVDMVRTGTNSAFALMGDRATGLAAFSDTSAVTTYSSAVQPGPASGSGSAARLGELSGLAGRAGLLTLFGDTRSQTLTASGVFRAGLPLSQPTRRGGVVTSAGTYQTVGCALERPVGSAVGSLSECASVDGPPETARFRDPQGVAIDVNADVYVADTGNHTIRKVTAAGVASTIAGLAGVSGIADGNGTTARFDSPTGVAVDASGVVYVTDSGNHTIRRIAADGTVTTMAGVAGTNGSSDGTGAVARFHTPTGLAWDGSGGFYVADRWNHLIRHVTLTGVVTTVAGGAGIEGSNDGTESTARFREPTGVWVDEAGVVYVSDARNYTVRVIHQNNAALPTITTHPAGTRVNTGATATFQVAASGIPVPGFKWEVSSTQGQTWGTLTDQNGYAGTLTSTLSVPASATNHGWLFRCIVGNVAGSVPSNSATLLVNTLTPERTLLRFGATRNSAGAVTAVTAPQTIRLSYFSEVVPAWTTSTTSPYLQITNGSGTGAGVFEIGVNTGTGPSNLNAVSVSASVTVSAGNANLTATILVQIAYDDAGGTSAAPLGHLDTPVNGAQGLSGAIVVSGWAVDDVEVERVEIWRDWVPGESAPAYVGPGPGNGKVFVAHGLFGPGTRPDIESHYFNYPLSYRGGWGYMLLTYGFPNGGNGTFTLHAFAYDREGHYSAIGSKTIGVNNNAATKPFGTIDTPDQHGAVSGVYTAVGWVLTPNVNGVPACTFDHIVMELDSNQVYIPVTYGLSRPDVTAAFPGLSTSSAPGASAAFDSATFTNGIHTIGWLAYDTCGRGEGIGSRFITITNSGGADTAVRPTRDLRSIGLDAPELPRQTVRVDVMARAEFTLPAIEGATWSGREIVSGEARQLPAGSSLDPATGRFAWRPMAGFFGTFDLRFVAHVGGVAVAQVPVRVVVGPGVRLAIDMPSSHEQVPGVFTIAGWVADLGASEGTGIDAVHVWAYPLDGGGDPIFAGHAGLGALRPDVAEVYGAQFEASGYYLTVGHLPRGWYDLVVYPHSSVDGEFRGARVVRVMVR